MELSFSSKAVYGKVCVVPRDLCILKPDSLVTLTCFFEKNPHINSEISAATCFPSEGYNLNFHETQTFINSPPTSYSGSTGK